MESIVDVCVACGGLKFSDQGKLCGQCDSKWKESEKPYATWLITLPDDIKEAPGLARSVELLKWKIWQKATSKPKRDYKAEGYDTPPLASGRRYKR